MSENLSNQSASLFTPLYSDLSSFTGKGDTIWANFLLKEKYKGIIVKGKLLMLIRKRNGLI